MKTGDIILLTVVSQGQLNEEFSHAVAKKIEAIGKGSWTEVDGDCYDALILHDFTKKDMSELKERLVEVKEGLGWANNIDIYFKVSSMP